MDNENNYKTLCDALNNYTDLWNKGLKKKANAYIDDFVKSFFEKLDKNSSDELLYRFCLEFCDQNKHDNLKKRGNLPHELNRIVWEYLKENCILNRMPHMRYIYQIYGRYHNPFNRYLEFDICSTLKKAYEHKQCDDKTVCLYFNEQLNYLSWGMHHFPDSCIITKQTYIELVNEAEKIISEHTVPQNLIDDLNYFKNIYEIYFNFEKNGKTDDFYKLCSDAGIEFEQIPTFYYL